MWWNSGFALVKHKQNDLSDIFQTDWQLKILKEERKQTPTDRLNEGEKIKKKKNQKTYLKTIAKI